MVALNLIVNVKKIVFFFNKYDKILTFVLWWLFFIIKSKNQSFFSVVGDWNQNLLFNHQTLLIELTVTHNIIQT